MAARSLFTDLGGSTVAMKKAFEIRVAGSNLTDTVKIRIVAIAQPGEYRLAFMKRSRDAASHVFTKLIDQYGPMNVEWVKK